MRNFPRLALLCWFLASVALSEAGDYDSSIKQYFGDVVLTEPEAGVSRRNREGFQFFLSQETMAYLVTCILDHDYKKDRPHWKLVLRQCKLPAPSHLKIASKPNQITGFAGNYFVAYIDPNIESEILRLISELNSFNNNLNSNFAVNETTRVDPIIRHIEMQISVVKNFTGKGSFVNGTYIGRPESKRPPSFELYERSVLRLVKLVGLDLELK